MKDPKQYAEELVDKMRLSSLKISKKDAVNCALITIDQILNLETITSTPENVVNHVKYFYKVKTELEKLIINHH